ncbi:hypothetical protein PENNAL_c0063G03031 [Penicillium nalgiovense]|uniref:HIG1 domain-containing protein n=2 Tax=Penicillium nalgiovense TaxID=60175 RepID=A0A1V6XPB6_PENNA|nr:hypothetical protein PENNAL_c0063G03031 [Penicillium nalgiovense]
MVRAREKWRKIVAAESFTGRDSYLSEIDRIKLDHKESHFSQSRDRPKYIPTMESNQQSTSQQLFSWVRDQKYKLAGVTFAASMVGSFILVGRNPYLTGKQKIVQARVYAQGLTLAVIVSLAALDMSDRRKPYIAHRKEVVNQSDAEH